MRVRIHLYKNEDILFRDADRCINQGKEIIVHKEGDQEDIIANFNYDNPNVLGVSTEG